MQKNTSNTDPIEKIYPDGNNSVIENHVITNSIKNNSSSIFNSENVNEANNNKENSNRIELTSEIQL